MESIITINAGDFLNATCLAVGKVSKHRRSSVRVLLEVQSHGHLTIIDLPYHRHGQEIAFTGDFQGRVEVDGRALAKIAATPPKGLDMATLHSGEASICARLGATTFTLPRIDKEGKQTQRRPLPHTKPPPMEADPVVKRVARNDTWGFSAHVPMPPEALRDPWGED
jgi:hypothetical protein